MPRKPPTNVVVITGASSAIGQALALEFAVRGDAVVVAAKTDELLETPKRACEMLGAWTHGVVVPERDERAMRELATSAIERFGRIDVWVNHAAPFERVGGEEGSALAAEMATFDHGARTAMVVFGAQQRGVLVNVDGYANMTTVSDESRAAVRAQFADIEKKAATVPNVVAHSIVTSTDVSWQDLARRVVDLSRSVARGDTVGRAIALLTRQQMKLWTGARKVRRRIIRNDAADTVVLRGAGGSDGSRTRGDHNGAGSRRRGGWHLAQTEETERATTLMALVALPLVMAAVMLALVRG